MADLPKPPDEALVQLIDELDQEAQQLDEAQLLAEGAEDFGSIEALTTHFDQLVDSACDAAGRQRLAAARQGFDNSRTTAAPGDRAVLAWPLERKLALLAELRAQNHAASRYTLAARNEAQLAADIDQVLEDLLELGAIDDQGRLR